MVLVVLKAENVHSPEAASSEGLLAGESQLRSEQHTGRPGVLVQSSPPCLREP